MLYMIGEVWCFTRILSYDILIKNYVDKKKFID